MTTDVKIFSEKTIKSEANKELIERTYQVNQYFSNGETADFVSFVGDHRLVYGQMSSEVGIRANLLGVEVNEIISDFQDSDFDEEEAKDLIEVLNGVVIDENEVYTLEITW